MANLILKVEEVEQYMKKGMPDGVEPLVEYVPYLLNRIYELERALIPFGRVGVQPTKEQLVKVYTKDCQRAFNVLSKAAAIAAQPTVQVEMPAEM